jgi:multiple sugar transport system substrate-binding protein
MNGSPRPGGAVTRRGLLRASLAGAGAMAVAGCSTPVGAGLANTELDPGTVEYWNLFGGGDGVRMRQMEDGYRQANPGTRLQAVTLAWGNPPARSSRPWPSSASCGRGTTCCGRCWC